jgi:peptidoglycan/LPS O-acetylase OafA/YrhL
MNSAYQEIKFVDYIRAFASLFVALAHIYNIPLQNFHDSTASLFARLCSEFIYTGGFGVCMFFILSGFIIPFSYKNMESFFIRRVFRIFPVFFFACLLSLVLTRHFQLKYLLSYTLVFADLFDAPTILDGVDWTLRIEFLFYLFAGVLLFFGKLDLFTIWIANLALLYLNFIGDHDRCLPLIYSDLLLIGITFFLYQTKRIDFSSFLCSLLAQSALSFAIFRVYEANPYKFLMYPLLAIGCFTFLFFIENKLKSFYWIKLLSNCSYSLYLTHNLFFAFFLRKLSFMPAWASHIIIWGMLFCFCSLIYQYIELRCMNYARNLYLKQLKKRFYTASDSR